MSVTLIISVLVRALAAIWSLFALWRLRDRRIVFLSVMLILMTVRQVLTLFKTAGSLAPLDVTSNLDELPGLVVSLMAFVVVLNLDSLLKQVRSQAKAQRELAASEKRYRNLVENSPFCIHEIDLDGRLSSMNDAGLAMIGLSDETEIIGVDYLTAVTPAGQPRVGQLLEQARSGTASHFEFESPQGQTFDSCFVPILNEDGSMRHIMGITQDITDRRAADQALKRSEQRFRSLIENSFDVIAMFDAEGTVNYMSPSVKRVLGYSPDELIGRSGFELVHPGDVTAARTDLERLNRGSQEAFHMTHRLRHRNGGYRTVEITAMNMLSVKGVEAIVANFQDITQRHQAQQALSTAEQAERASRQQLELITDNIPSLIAYIDADERFRTVNARFTDWYKVRRDELIGRRVEDVQPAELYAVTGPLIRSALNGQSIDVERSIVTPDGVARDVLIRFVPHRSDIDEVMGIFALVTDVSELTRAREELRQSEMRFRTIFEQAAVGVAQLDSVSGVIL